MTPSLQTRRSCILAATAAVVASGSAVGPLGAEEASASRWIGTLEGKTERSSRLVSGGATSHGDFFWSAHRVGR